jgi:hypothetical protein
MKAIFISQFDPIPVGHGGNHRAYQIVHDLQSIVGDENVITVIWQRWHRHQVEQRQVDPPKPASKLRQHIHRVRLKLHGTFNRFRFLAGDDVSALFPDSHPSIHRYRHPAFTAHYTSILDGLSEPAVCVIEDTSFTNLMELNQSYQIPTVACLANIESYDRAAPLSLADHRRILQASLDFVTEFQDLGLCDARLFISRVETGLVGGLGLSAYYYPYLPVGEIRAGLLDIRSRRQVAPPVPGLFVIVGNAFHKTVFAAFHWFVQQVRSHGLPDNIRIVFCGKHTDTLLAAGKIPPGLELRGWVEQDELDDLLCRASAVLIPQSTGFGALTRVPELALAGIPVVMSTHPSYALNVPPSVNLVEGTWDAWVDGMQDCASVPTYPLPEYAAWESTQPQPLSGVLQALG